ncbi:MAG TPA: hypothetical protein VF121_07030 [Thermoanaerobaculia bacterium]|nr:hypothetical protein [Thermoanaerobaculia bacterium]
MARSDSIKEELGWLKLVFGVVVAIDASLVAWVAQNLGGPKRVLTALAVAVILILVAVLVWLNVLAYRRIRELERIE